MRYRCTGCTRECADPDEDLRLLRSKPGVISCCPERKMRELISDEPGAPFRYDLAAMDFHPDIAYTRDDARLNEMFLWVATPEGRHYWAMQQARGMTHKGLMAINAMLEQYEKENGIV